MTAPTIGVAMSLYNQRRFVEEAIESLLDQTLTPDQIVVVDDSSTDGGPDVAERFSRHGVRVERVRRRGVSTVLNHAVDLLTTDIVAIQACDDVSEADRLEWQREVLGSSNASAVFALPTVIDEQSRAMPDSFAHEFFTTGVTDEDSLHRLFFTGNWLCASSAFMRRSDFIAAGRFHPSLLHLQDFLLWVRLTHRGPLEVIPERLVRYRRNSAGGNLSSTANDARMRAEMAYVYKVFFDGCADARIAEAFPELAGDHQTRDLPAIAELCLQHPDYLVKQVGLEMVWAATEAAPTNDATSAGLGEPFEFFTLSNASDVDRRTQAEQIYSRLLQRAPWRLDAEP